MNAKRLNILNKVYEFWNREYSVCASGSACSDGWRRGQEMQHNSVVQCKGGLTLSLSNKFLFFHSDVFRNSRSTLSCYIRLAKE